MRWVGIDEAGYGPNLGPMVMTAVVAESTGPIGNGAEPDFWLDLGTTVDRAGGDPDRIWIDDSKAILHRGKGRERLDIACLAVVGSVGNAVPGSINELLDALDSGSLAETELSHWLLAGADETWPLAGSRAEIERITASRPFEPRRASWRLTAIRSVVVGPARFNDDLASMGLKSRVHFAAFARLLRPIWDLAVDGRFTGVRGDKHGGRHYYLGPLIDAFPDAWIDRGPEGPELSRYTLRDGSRRLELTLCPRADASNGLVALASIVSKSVRELWMDAFNAYWRERVPGLRPTAGYPIDALRFRRDIEAAAALEGRAPRMWWRDK